MELPGDSLLLSHVREHGCRLAPLCIVTESLQILTTNGVSISLALCPSIPLATSLACKNSTFSKCDSCLRGFRVYAGLGWVLWRDESLLHKDLIFELREATVFETVDFWK